MYTIIAVSLTGGSKTNTIDEFFHVGYTWDRGQLRATWHRYAFRAGIFYGVANGSPDDFRTQLAIERPASADLWTADFGIDRPYQQVTHDVASLHGVVFGALAAVGMGEYHPIDTGEGIDALRRNRRIELKITSR